MSVSVLVSAAGGGTSVAAAALWQTWPRPVVLVEADPVGAGLPGGLLSQRSGPADGILGWALATGRGAPPVAELARYTLAVDGVRSRLLVTGVTDPAQYPTVSQAAERLMAAWAALAEGDPPTDVLVDAGRLITAPAGLLRHADLLLVVVRGSLRGAAAAARWLPMLGRTCPPVEAGGSRPEIRLLVVGETPYSARELARALDLPVAGVLPWDPRGAAALVDQPAIEAGWARRPLARAAAALAKRLCSQPGPQPGTVAPSSPATEDLVQVRS